MDREAFKKLAAAKTIVLDGATGTLMQEKGMPSGVCPDLFAIEHPDMLRSIQRAYYEAGADIIYTFTFGSNRTKLSHYGIDPLQTAEINSILAAISCEVRDEMRVRYPDRCFYVAGGMAPTGEFLVPAGGMAFDELAGIYREQAEALEKGGVDLFVIETMMDLAQTRAAVIGIREVSLLPVIATLTFDKGRTLSGNTPAAGLVTLEPLGVDAYGANCSTGPKEMLATLRGLYDISALPLVAKPNAGMPARMGGKTVFPMDAQEFGQRAADFAAEGVSLIGGCCGTTPGHIGELAVQLGSVPSAVSAAKAGPSSAKTEYIASFCRIAEIGPQTAYAYAVCGDPTEFADVLSEADEEDTDCIIADFSGSSLTDDADRTAVLEAFLMAGLTCRVPLGIRTDSPVLLEAIARIYTGRLLYAASETVPAGISDITAKYGMLSVTM